MRGIYLEAFPALCVEDVHEPVFYGHDVDGALAFVRGFMTRARTSQA
jgi:hypothetical protein